MIYNRRRRPSVSYLILILLHPVGHLLRFTCLSFFAYKMISYHATRSLFFVNNNSLNVIPHLVREDVSYERVSCHPRFWRRRRREACGWKFLFFGLMQSELFSYQNSSSACVRRCPAHFTPFSHARRSLLLFLSPIVCIFTHPYNPGFSLAARIWNRRFT